MRTASAIALSAFASVAAAQNWLGFNTASTNSDNSAKFQADFAKEFTTAQNLKGAPGDFNSFRLYTNIQAYSTSDPIQAFGAAVQTKTHLLLGVWASGTTNINNEISALQKGIQQYGDDLANLIIGISIGSEDLYRDGVTGTTNKAGVGAGPDVIVSFIQDYKKAFANTALASVPVGHVDTWDAWTNTTNSAVIENVDWLGVDEYPYYENGKGNTIENAPALFASAYDATIAVAGGKKVWVTETGWPLTGINWDQAVPSLKNAEYYWDYVGCRTLFGKTPTFWYTLDDSNTVNKQTFGISQDLSTTPLFNLTCPSHYAAVAGESSTTSATTGLSTKTKSGSSSKATGSSSKAKATATGSSSSSTSGSGSGSSSGSGSNDSSNSAASSASGSTPSGTATGSSTTASSTKQGAGSASFQTLSAATYAGLAIVAGVFAMF